MTCVFDFGCPIRKTGDEKDGVVNVTSDLSATNPDRNHTGTYTITYTAEDAAGNVATATRTVIVYNEADVLAGNYTVTDTTRRLQYHDVINYSQTENRKITFSKFAAYDPAVVYATLSGSGELTVSSSFNVPSQLVVNAGNPPADRTFQGQGAFNTFPSPVKFTINYTEFTNGQSLPGRGIYTKN